MILSLLCTYVPLCLRSLCVFMHLCACACACAWALLAIAGVYCMCGCPGTLIGVLSLTINRANSVVVVIQSVI